MDFISKQKAKKRRTRKNLDNLRKRSLSTIENNRNPTCVNTIEYKNELITSNRLSLALFKRSIRSKTVTRAPLYSIDNTENVAIPEQKTSSNILINSLQSLIPCNDVTISQNNITFKNTHIENSLLNHNEYKECSSVTSSSPSNNEVMHFEDSTSEEFKLKCEYLSNSSCYSTSDIESSHCYYETFMKGLPIYLKEHFPALTSNFVNKNVAYLKQNYLENSYHEREDNGLKCNNPATNIFDDGTQSVMQNPMDYIQTGASRKQTTKDKQRILFSNSSTPSLSEYRSNTSDIFMNSPDYRYFPHILNQ